MRYVTVAMIAAHVGLSIFGVRYAMKQAGIKGEKFPGVRGIRIPLNIANKFICKHWPEVGPMTIEIPQPFGAAGNQPPSGPVAPLPSNE